MGRSAVLVRLVAVGAVTVVAGGVLASTPVSAQTPAAASAASPNTPVVSPALVRRDALTPRAAKKTGLKITVVGVSAGGRASVTVTGPKQSKAKKAKKGEFKRWMQQRLDLVVVRVADPGLRLGFAR